MKLTNVLIASAAIISLAACGRDPYYDQQRGYREACIDSKGRYVDDDYCDRNIRGSSFVYIPYHMPYPAYGSQAAAGSYYTSPSAASSAYLASPAGKSAMSGSTARGGFGSTASSSSNGVSG